MLKKEVGPFGRRVEGGDGREVSMSRSHGPLGKDQGTIYSETGPRTRNQGSYRKDGMSNEQGPRTADLAFRRTCRGSFMFHR